MVREGDHKLVVHTAPGHGLTQQLELYNLHADPKELTNIAAHPGSDRIIARLRGVFHGEVGKNPEEIEQTVRAIIGHKPAQEQDARPGDASSRASALGRRWEARTQGGTPTEDGAQPSGLTGRDERDDKTPSPDAEDATGGLTAEELK
eukprot:gene13878-16402_t